MELQITLTDSKNKKIVLTEDTVHHIVREWYTNGMMPDVFQNDGGSEVDEVLSEIESDQFEISTRPI